MLAESFFLREGARLLVDNKLGVANHHVQAIVAILADDPPPTDAHGPAEVFVWLRLSAAFFATDH